MREANLYKATLTFTLIFLSALLAHGQPSQGVAARTQPAARSVGAHQEYQPQQQPVPIAAQQPTASSAGAGETSNPAAAPPSPSAHVPDVGEFILVRRDGKILFASVYSIVGSEIRYVTPEGIRRTLPVTELDAEATRAMNEACGTTVQF